MKITEERGKIIITKGLDQDGNNVLLVDQTGEFTESYILELGALEMAKDILQREHHQQMDE
ncbi:hypothetical protein [Mobiluncus curtisii]|uniref:Uncharacterized protein n=1 Tax=Mobiluncus curtisii ATCC 51333 TaxID=887326 RepID=E6M125_9ACTO|nr:hypothetical protein [Mobiluncus curtisii]EFU79655.1 hypothetical protein HMPREF0388_1758 [Mobiluncus curtisii ATCC 51333]